MRAAHVVYTMSLAVAAFDAGALGAQTDRSPVLARADDDSLITIPANTRIITRTERAFSTRYTHPGDTILLRTAYPVLVGSRVIIPAGTFVETTLTSAEAHGSAPVQIALRVDRLIFSNGYVATAAIPGRAASSDSSFQVTEPPTLAQELVGEVAIPAAGGAVGAAIGAATHGRQGAFVGLAVGTLVVAAIAAAKLVHHADQALEAGSPIDLELGSSLTLALQRAASAPASGELDAVGLAATRAAACRRGTTTIPETPPTVIPGTPGTPAVGDVPAIPAMPDVIIPGTPAQTRRPLGCR
jgi:type IV secretion system protein VirB10